MIGIEKVLMRKDASSLIVAIILALATLQFIATVTAPAAAKILDQAALQIQGSSFKDQYVAPLVVLALQVVAVEILVWVISGTRTFLKPKTSAKKKK